MGDREPVVLCGGGLLEGFFSLAVVSALRKQLGRQISWCGPEVARTLCEAQGLAAPIDPLPADLCARFPLPIFMDAEDRVYFNLLCGYEELVSIRQLETRPNPALYAAHICSGSLLPWSVQHLPSFRGFGAEEEVVVAPDELGWNLTETKRAVEGLRARKLRVLVLPGRPHAFPGIAGVEQFSAERWVSAASAAQLAVTGDPRLALVAVGAGATFVLTRTSSDPRVDPGRTADFLGTRTVILTTSSPSPSEVVSFAAAL